MAAKKDEVETSPQYLSLDRCFTEMASVTEPAKILKPSIMSVTRLRGRVQSVTRGTRPDSLPRSSCMNQSA